MQRPRRADRADQCHGRYDGGGCVQDKRHGVTDQRSGHGRQPDSDGDTGNQNDERLTQCVAHQRTGSRTERFQRRDVRSSLDRPHREERTDHQG